MKAILFLLLITFSFQVLYAQTNCTNIPPVAIAGNDTIINNNQTTCITPLPITITLNGSNSFDPDGILVSYLWAGLIGITSPNAAVTTVTGLLPGTYTFILRVTDNSGAFTYDTINISIIPGNRPLIPARLIQIGTLSESRGVVAVAAAGNKILFAGGGASLQNGCATSRVDMYDIVTGIWTTAQLSAPRVNPAATVLGNKIFFGGGIVPEPYGNGCGVWNLIRDRSDVVDIYDVVANTWNTAQLDRARCPTGISVANKVFFAGGEATFPVFNNHTFDTYNAGNNSWSDTLLTNTSPLRTPVAVGNKIYYAGGINDGLIGNYPQVWVSKRIDIYDASSNS